MENPIKNFITNIHFNENHYFKHLLKWNNIVPGNHRYGYLNCEGFPDQQFLYRIITLIKATSFGDIADRTQQLHLPYNYHYFRPWKVPTTYHSFSDTCDIVAKEISKKYSEVALFWSGGLDSQCVLVSLIKNMSFWKNRVNIYFSKDSVIEHPTMYNWLINEKTKMYLLDYSWNMKDIHGHIVTGDSGDTTFAILEREDIENKWYEMPWEQYFYNKGITDNDLEKLAWYFKFSGRDIITYAEAKWWLWEITKGQCKSMHVMNYFPWLNFGDYTSFFDHELFGAWSFFNTDKFMNGHYPAGFRTPEREYIYEFDHDSNYYNCKEKVSSSFLSSNCFSKFVINDNMFFFIDNNGHRVKTPNLPYINKNEFYVKYGNTYDTVFNKPTE